MQDDQLLSGSIADNRTSASSTRASIKNTWWVGPSAGFAAHVLDGQQHFLAVLADTQHDQQHDRGGLAVEPDPHDGAIQDQTDD
jgi:hypothetical protein